LEDVLNAQQPKHRALILQLRVVRLDPVLGLRQPLQGQAPRHAERELGAQRVVLLEDAQHGQGRDGRRRPPQKRLRRGLRGAEARRVQQRFVGAVVAREHDGRGEAQLVVARQAEDARPGRERRARVELPLGWVRRVEVLRGRHRVEVLPAADRGGGFGGGEHGGGGVEGAQRPLVHVVAVVEIDEDGVDAGAGAAGSSRVWDDACCYDGPFNLAD